MIDKNTFGFNQIYNFGNGDQQANPDNFAYFRDIIDISYFLLSASEKVVSFLRNVDLEILLKIKERVKDDLNRITFAEITSNI